MLIITTIIIRLLIRLLVNTKKKRTPHVKQQIADACFGIASVARKDTKTIREKKNHQFQTSNLLWCVCAVNIREMKSLFTMSFVLTADSIFRSRWLTTTTTANTSAQRQRHTAREDEDTARARVNHPLIEV